MKKIATLSALAALSSALYLSPVAQACDGHEGKSKPLARMDTNADGKVTQQEMLATWTARFEAADVNKDGQVTPQERSTARVAKMQQRIGSLDTNKNGSIEKGEARGPLSRLFAEIDADKNGTLSSTELAAHQKDRSEGRVRKQHEAGAEATTKAELTAKVSQHFKRLDGNSDGVLSDDELSRGRRHGRRGQHGRG